MRSLGALLGLVLVAAQVRPLAEYCALRQCPGFAEAEEQFRQAAWSGCGASLSMGRCGDLHYLQARGHGELLRSYFAPDGGLVTVLAQDGPDDDLWYGAPPDCRLRRQADLCDGGAPVDGGSISLQVWCARHPCRSLSSEVQSQREAADAGCISIGACGDLLYLEQSARGGSDTRFFGLDGALVGVQSQPDEFLDIHLGQVPRCIRHQDESTCPEESSGGKEPEHRPLSDYCHQGRCPTYFGLRIRIEQAPRGQRVLLRTARCGGGHLLGLSDGFIAEEFFFDAGGALVSVGYQADDGNHRQYGPSPGCQPEPWHWLLDTLKAEGPR